MSLVEKRKIAFCGSDEIALPMLESICSLGQNIQITAILTQPDRRSGRGRKLNQNPIKLWGSKKNLEIRSPLKPGMDEIEWLQEMGADLILVMAYGHLLSEQFLSLAPRGCYNMHASLLPKYRGASPIETSLACGDKTTGVTLMKMVRQMDAGPIVDQESVSIDNDENGPSLRKKLGEGCVPLIQRNLSDLLFGKVQQTEQLDDQVTYCRKLEKSDAFLDFSLSAELLACRSRAFASWPGSIFVHDDICLRVGACEALSIERLLPGEVEITENNDFRIGTGKGSLRILEVQKPGGRMLPTSDFLRGYSISNGSKLSSSSGRPLVSKVFN